MDIMLLLNWWYGVGVTLPDKVQNFGLYIVGQIEESLKSKLVDEYVECFNELILVIFTFW